MFKPGGKIIPNLGDVSVMMAVMALVCPILKITKFNSTFDLKGQHSFKLQYYFTSVSSAVVVELGLDLQRATFF